jgi:hypothetical protein
MASILNIGKDKYLTVDRIWRDNGKDPEYALVGGSKVLIDKGSKAKPVICQYGSTFFYMDGTPVSDVADVEHLPEPFRSTAVKFIKKDEKEAPKVTSSKEEAEIVAQAPRKRGRPKKAEAKPAKKIEIKDEESYRNAGGIVV